MSTPEGLCTKCSATRYCAEHQPRRRKKRKPQPDPEHVRFTNGMAKAVPGYTITNLSEQDIRDLYDGRVPAWLHDVVAFELRDHPKPSDVPPKEQEAEPLEKTA